VYTPKDFDITQIMRDVVALVGARAGEELLAAGPPAANRPA
jgi:hypothetical protein